MNLRLRLVSLAAVLCLGGIVGSAGAAQPNEEAAPAPASTPAAERGLINPFFAMETGTRDERHTTPESQAAMLKELGYAGMDHMGTAGIPERLKALDARKLKLFAIYTGVTIDGDGPKYEAGLKTALEALKGRETIVWLFVLSKTHKPSSPEGDPAAVEVLREIAEMAAASGLRVAIYPHTGFWVERVDDAVRLAEKVERKNLGVTFNLCHSLKVDGEAGMRERLAKASPRLFLVTINGADSGGPSWKELIQTLDRGSFDVGNLLAVLKGLGYRGPIGLQGYGIGGDVNDNLRRSMEAWRKFSERISAGGSGVSVANGAPQKPNIVYILADELGYYELSCMGHPRMKTPNIDRLAAQGVRFTQALAGCSVCAPTRCCLMTGKHSGHTSVRTNPGGTPMRADEETIASVLKRAGYRTGGFGKWGCGGRGSTGVPEKHGFDTFVGYYDQVHAHSYYPPYLVRNSEELPLPGNTGGRSGKTYSHYVIMDAAKQFIRERKDQPFFCYLPVTPPHGMFDIPDDDPAWALYRDEPWPIDAKRYAAMVAMLDRHVGEILALLKELGLDEKTIVFFSGDNGGMDYFASEQNPRGFHGPNVDPKTGAAFRGQKGTLYEGGLRIPLFVRWPGAIEAGRVSDHLWYFPDVLPTLAELAGVNAPADTDGVSIVPELLGAARAGRVQARHEYLYWEYGAQVAVRLESWKAVKPGANAAWELYDLGRDPGEHENIAARQPDILARMQEIARKAHEPAREGTFHAPALQAKDQAAKGG